MGLYDVLARSAYSQPRSQRSQHVLSRRRFRFRTRWQRRGNIFVLSLQKRKKVRVRCEQINALVYFISAWKNGSFAQLAKEIEAATNRKRLNGSCT